MYAKSLTKEYLIKLGVTDVSRDGQHIMKGDKEVHQSFCKATGYMIAAFYDKDKYKRDYPKTHKNNAGEVPLGVHRIVWVWYHEKTTAGLVIDHINNNKVDNRLENLQEITVKGNTWKSRVCDVRTLKCKMSRPLSYYEDKLNRYQYLYEQAKLAHDAKTVHKLRSNLSATRARIRYYLQHWEN